MKKPLKQRIEDLSMPEPNSGCRLWFGRIRKDGYGLISMDRVNGKKKKTGTHRAAYMAFIGPIPPGLIVCHKCDTPACVNPDHLWLGTFQDNVDDMFKKGRSKRGLTYRGDPNMKWIAWHKQSKRFQVVIKGVYVGLFKTVELAQAAIKAKQESSPANEVRHD